MALDLSQALAEYLTNAPARIRSVAVLSLSHSALSQVWHLWVQQSAGQVRLETNAVVDVVPANMTIELAGSEGNLDQEFSVTIDTLGAPQFRAEMDRIPLATAEKVQLMYREYLSDSLLDGPQGQVPLQVESVAFELGAATISAVSPRLKVTRTGSTYSPRNIPMLRGFK